eukprot:1284290-Rhodomonas_salina.1
MAVHESSVGVRVAWSACSSSGWLSDTTLQCSASAGVASDLAVQATIALQFSTFTSGISYDDPRLLQTTVETQPLAYPSLIYEQESLLLGVVDNTPRARIGMSSCASTQWISSSVVRGRAAAGTFPSRRVSVTVARRVASLSDAIHYLEPFPSTTGTASNTPWMESPFQDIKGENFGSVSYSLLARGGHSASLATAWVSDTHVATRYGSGALLSRSIVVTSGMLSGSISAALSYDTFVIDQTAECSNQAHGRQSCPLSMHGRFQNIDPTFRTRLGATNTETTRWISFTSITSWAPSGKSKSINLVLTGGQAVRSATHIVSYDTQRLSKVVLGNTQSSGSMISIRGNGFGNVQYSPFATVALTQAEAT